MTSFKKITHVIYDMDGLLLDTEILYTEVTQKIVGRFGKVFDWSVKSKMIGRKAIDSARILVDSLDLPIRPEEYMKEKNDLLNRILPSAQPLPFAQELTRHLNQHNIPQAVATSSSQEGVDHKTTLHHEWFSLFETIVTADHPEVKKGKPAPDLFLTAAQEMGATPDLCLVFEDAPSGVEAALNAGMSVIAVPDPKMDKSVYKNAHQTLGSLKEFQPQLWQLPAYQ